MEIIEETKAATTKFNEKKNQSVKQKIYIYLLAFLLITIVSLIAVSIYCYLIKYKSKQNIYYHITSQMTNKKNV